MKIRLPSFVTTPFGRAVTPPIIVGTLQDLHKVPADTRATLLLGGELILITTDSSVAPMDDFVPQPDRNLHAMGLGNKAAAVPLHLWVHAEAAAFAANNPQLRILLIPDQYLHYARGKRDLTCLVTGFCGPSTSSIIAFYTFAQGRLTSVTERTLPAISNSRFQGDFAHLIEELARSQRMVAIADPLPPPESSPPNVIYIGRAPYEHLTHLPITVPNGATRLSAAGMPAAIVCVALALYFAAIFAPYVIYDNAISDYRATTRSIPENTRFGANQLKRMQQQRLLLTNPRPQESGAKFLTTIAEATVKERAKITELTLNFTPDPQKPDVAFTLQVPPQPVSPLEQARPLLDHLAQALHLKLRLAQNGYRTDNNSAFFTIEADEPTSPPQRTDLPRP